MCIWKSYPLLRFYLCFCWLKMCIIISDYYYIHFTVFCLHKCLSALSRPHYVGVCVWVTFLFLQRFEWFWMGFRTNPSHHSSCSTYRLRRIQLNSLIVGNLHGMGTKFNRECKSISQSRLRMAQNYSYSNSPFSGLVTFTICWIECVS